MPLDPVRAADTRLWLAKADQDLAAADLLLAPGREMPGIAAFHCQQAAEKALKAFLYWHDVVFRKTHAIEEVGADCVRLDPSLKPAVDAVLDLTPYAWRFRYPGDATEPDAGEVRAALQAARNVRDAVSSRLPTEAVP